MICPSVDADSKVLNERDTARTVTGVRWPNSDTAGCKSMVLPDEVYVHIEIVQSTPDVTSVRESAKIAHDSWPTCSCSK